MVKACLSQHPAKRQRALGNLGISPFWTLRARLGGIQLLDGDVGLFAGLEEKKYMYYSLNSLEGVI